MSYDKYYNLSPYDQSRLIDKTVEVIQIEAPLIRHAFFTIYLQKRIYPNLDNKNFISHQIFKKNNM